MHEIVSTFIITKNDGHSFFPYSDFIYEHHRQPTVTEVIEFVESVLDSLELPNRDDDTNEAINHQRQLLDRYRNEREYRQQATKEAVAYILDMDWDNLLADYD